MQSGHETWFRYLMTQQTDLQTVSTAPSWHQRLSHYLVDLGLRLFLGLARLFPYRYRIAVMGWLTARIIAPLAGYDARVRRNLRMVCPELPQSAVDHLARAVPDNFGRTLMEIYSGPEFIERAGRATVTGAGAEELRAALSRKRPIIFAAAHFGNYDAARARLIALGFEVGLLYRPLRNRYFNAHYVRAMSRIGTPLFEPTQRGLLQMVRHLRAGKAIFVLTDINSVDGAPLEFFGRPAKTTLNIAELALRNDALMLPVYGRRSENGLDFEIIVQPAIPHTDPQTMMETFNHDLEAHVRENMEQWFWVHRRWKT